MNELPLSRKGVITAIAIAGIVAVIAVFIATYTGSDDTSEPSAADPSPSPQESLDADQALDWLPHDPETLVEAGQVAVEFTELYTTVSDGETVDAYYETLRSYTTSDYADRLDPSAGVRSAREGLIGEGITISSSAQVDRVRTLVDEQVTFLVAVTTTTNSDQGQQTDDYEVAVTMVPTNEGQWQVHDLQVAADGQSGDTPEGMPGT